MNRAGVKHIVGFLCVFAGLARAEDFLLGMQYSNPAVFSIQAPAATDSYFIAYSAIGCLTNGWQRWSVRQGIDAYQLFDVATTSSIRYFRLGRRLLTDPADVDEDGMPDGWEVRHGLDPLADDSHEDVEPDGFANRDELIQGSNPRAAWEAASAESFGMIYYQPNEVQAGGE